MGLSSIRIISIPVFEQDLSKDFYCGVLGAQVVSDVQMNSHMRWVELALCDVFPHIALVTWFEGFGPGSMKGLVIESSDLEGDRVRLDQFGVAHNGIETAPWGRYISIQDPDGNGIILQNSAEAE